MSTYFQTLAGSELYRSEQLIIQQNYFYRWLMFQDRNCIQTLINRHRPHQPAMSYLRPFTLAARSLPGAVCLLGLGGGAILHYLKSCTNHSMTAVETNAEVIEVGKQYFGLNRLSGVTLLLEDAAQFMQHTTQDFQHILIDIYSEHGFPKHCAQPSFFKHCKQRLAPNGFLALNLVNVVHESAILQEIKSVFPQSNLCIPVAKTANLIILAAHTKTQLFSFIQSHPQLKSFIWDPFFGPMALLA